MTPASFFRFAVSVILCQFAGIAGAWATLPSIKTWYAALIKPVFNPPNWIFGPVWTVLYFFMGVALFLAWSSSADKAAKKKALILFAVQMALNVAWSWIFFGLRLPLLAYVDIVFLWAAIGLTVSAFRKISRAAAWLMTPYFFWVSFAISLNYYIVLLNA